MMMTDILCKQLLECYFLASFRKTNPVLIWSFVGSRAENYKMADLFESKGEGIYRLLLKPLMRLVNQHQIRLAQAQFTLMAG